MWISDLSGVATLRALALSGLAAALFVSLQQLLAIEPVQAPLYGARGKRRTEARASALFRALEPIIAQLAGWLSRTSLGGLRRWLALHLRYASEPGGLSADELLALSVLSWLGIGGSVGWLVARAGLSMGVVVLIVVLGAWLPIGRVHAEAKRRAKLLERSLPPAMDLCVLCMGAGADFPAALHFVVEELGAAHRICREELAQVLDELAFGRTRGEALRSLASRTSSVAVREFVAAVCQAEEKGTPLIAAFTIQSTTLRQRRSVRAEELAAQAGVKMMFPLMLLVTSLLLIVFGPIFTTGMGL